MEQTQENDETEWVIGEALNHKYEYDGCYYLVEDKSQKMGTEDQHEFTTEEIEEYKEICGQKVITKTKQESGKWTVVWSPFWAHSESITEETKSKYWESLRYVTRSRWQTKQHTAANYKVTLETHNPDKDIKADKIGAYSKGEDYVFHDEHGLSTGTIRKTQAHNMLRRVRNIDIGSEEQVTKAMNQTLRRYAPAREGQNDQKKNEHRQEWSLDASLAKHLPRECGCKNNLFTSPMTDEAGLMHSWTNQKADGELGYNFDAFSWNWHGINWALPPKELAAKTIKHACQAARTADKDTAVATYVMLEWENGEECERLAQAKDIRKLWALPKPSFDIATKRWGRGLQTRPSGWWAQKEEGTKNSSKGWMILIIANKKGFAETKEKSKEGDGEAWGRMRNRLRAASVEQRWEKEAIEYNPAIPETVEKLAELRSYDKETEGPEQRALAQHTSQWPRQWGWEQTKEKEDMKFDQQKCIFTDGSYGADLDGGGASGMAGGGVCGWPGGRAL